MLQGTKKLFPTDYKKFKEMMIEAAEENELPMAVELNDISKFTLTDLQDVCFEFNRDTSLNMRGEFFLCQECGQMHVMLIVDYSDEEETLLQ